MNNPMLHRIGSFLLALAATGPLPADGANAVDPAVQAELGELLPLLASRRMNVRDFAASREGWARLFGYERLEVRVRDLARDGDWLRVAFDQRREGRRPDGQVYQLAWNLSEQGPAPFAPYQAVSIWVSPDGDVDGFVLGHSVYRWRHREDGTVELQVVDRLVDGGVVLVQLIPDRYAGTGVGTVYFWEGEGLCVGAGGSVPSGLSYHPDDLEPMPGSSLAGYSPVGDEPNGKTSWVRPGLTPYLDEIRLVLRDLSILPNGMVEKQRAPDRLIPVGAKPAKIRLRGGERQEKKRKKAFRFGGNRSVEKVGLSWGRKNDSSPVGEPDADGSKKGGLFQQLLGKKSGERGPAEGEADEEAESAPETSESARDEMPEGAAVTSAEEEDSAATSDPEDEERDEEDLPLVGGGGEVSAGKRPQKAGWIRAIERETLQHRRKAFERFSSCESPGRSVSKKWVNVRYQNGPGEPLEAEPATLPLVPRDQLVSETRLEP